MSSNNNGNKSSRKRGMDALITTRGKALEQGQSVSFRLVKGPPLQTGSKDPVDKKAPPETFPLIAKFPESVVQPKFTQAPWNEGRLYQQDIPKPTDDSDEEAGEEPKKRWKYNRRRVEAQPRQWILQEQVDFLETMVARREKKVLDAQKISSRYEGMPEHNPSRYCLLMTNPNGGSSGSGGDIQVSMLPTPYSVVSFAQPAARQTLSLSQAEQAMEDSRAGIRTTLLQQEGGGSAPLRLPGRKPPNTSKSRLLNKLKSADKREDEEEADDVMGDVAFRKRAGGRSTTARQELFSSVAGDDVKVSEEGVLGGTNDAIFGGRQRFGRVQAEAPTTTKDANAEAVSEAEHGVSKERGADGAAMQDDFYQRDVAAEYDELDYDANEQFDDDDVDVGESEVQVDSHGYHDPGEDAVTDESGAEEEVTAGAEGLASVAGFKAMLAKARGEVQAQVAALESVTETEGDVKSPAVAKKEGETNDFLAKSMAAAEKTAAAAKKRAEQPAKKAAEPAAPTGPQVDENGLRIVSLDAVRREIWLHHGSIPMKRLMKIFEIKKKTAPERQEKFREVVKELCTMQADPINGRMLVLKQHYSKNA